MSDERLHNIITVNAGFNYTLRLSALSIVPRRTISHQLAGADIPAAGSAIPQVTVELNAIEFASAMAFVASHVDGGANGLGKVGVHKVRSAPTASLDYAENGEVAGEGGKVDGSGRGEQEHGGRCLGA